MGRDHIESDSMGLTESEQMTLVRLAEKGPLSGYDFHTKKSTKIMSSSTWLDIKKRLLDKQLITLKTTKGEELRGRRKDLYWLTGEGALMALVCGASPQSIFSKMQHFSDEEKNVLRIAQIEYEQMGHDFFIKTLRTGSQFLLQSFKETANPVIAHAITLLKLASLDLSKEEKEKLKKMLKHPEIKNLTEQFKKKINELF